MPQILNKKCNFTLRWFLRLGKHFLGAKSKTENFELFALYPCYFLSVVWLLHGQLLCIICLTHMMFISASGFSIFGPKVTWRGWVSTPNWVPSGFWSQPTYDPPSHSPEIAENTLPRLAPRFFKMWKCLQYPKLL